ncbi:MAG TPA: glycosyltransferase 87 family protein [Acidimicrobiales bacterium]
MTTGADAPDDPGSDGSPGSAVPSDETGRPSTRWVAVMSVLGVASAAWLLSRVWHDTWGRTQLDFAVYVLGAHHLMDGRLYQVGLPYPPYLPFTYPPVAPLAFWPLAVLPRQPAQLVWAAVNVASLYGVIALSLRAMLPGMDRTRLLLWSVVLLGPSYLLDPVRLTFYFGQVNLVLCLLLLADLTTTLRIRGRTLPRGVLVGAAAAVKLVPLVFVPYLFVTRQARAAWTALATFVACSLLATAFDPATSWAYWTKYATDAARVGNPSYILNQSLQGTLDRLTHRDVSVVVVDAVGALVLVGGIALARWAWRDSSSFLGILVCATTGMVVSPITWEHHLVWAVPILLWLVLARDRPAGGPLWAAAAALVLWRAPLQHVPSGGTRELHEHGWTLLAANSFFGLLMAFLVGVAVLLAARRARGARGTGGPVRGPASPNARTATTT